MLAHGYNLSSREAEKEACYRFKLCLVFILKIPLFLFFFFISNLLSLFSVARICMDVEPSIGIWTIYQELYP